MENADVFRASTAQRIVFSDLLESLTPEQLATQSLCGKWDVATVGGHLAAAITTKLSSFFMMMIRKGGSFDRANDAVAQRSAARGVAATIATIRDNAGSRFTPPGSGPRAPLTDVLVHTGDIARPLGLPHEAPADSVRTALEFLTGPRPVGFVRPRSLDGVRIVAEDLDVELGDGEEMRGRGIDLMMAMCGRTHALGEVHGPGVDTLRQRLTSQ
jgi:uncharacterized protein (TIGR03083 family)